MPKLGRFGAERGRFAILGFMTTFLGVFVNATGTSLAPSVAGSTPDRRIHVAAARRSAGCKHRFWLLASPAGLS